MKQRTITVFNSIYSTYHLGQIRAVEFLNGKIYLLRVNKIYTSIGLRSTFYLLF